MPARALSGKGEESPQCAACGEWVRLELRRGVVIEGRRVAGTAPVLACPRCSRVSIPDVVRRAARSSAGRDADLFPPRRFGLCGGMGFTYSSVDWDVIPLLRQSEDDPDGYYAPVFFDQRALLKYMVRPEYAMGYFGEGGTVRFANGSGLKYGITRNGRMVCWLGDLDRIPEQEQHYLLSDNLKSDHDVSSGLYRERLGITPGPSAEQRLAVAFIDAAEAATNRLQNSLWHLYPREVQTLANMARPVVWNEFVSYAVNGLYRVFVESLDLKFLNEELSRLNVDTKGSKQIDRLGMFLEARFGACDGLDLGPFRDLADWRNSMDHVSSDVEGANVDWERIRTWPQNPEYEKMYDAILDGLIKAYTRMTDIITAAQADGAGERDPTWPMEP